MASDLGSKYYELYHIIEKSWMTFSLEGGSGCLSNTCLFISW